MNVQIGIPFGFIVLLGGIVLLVLFLFDFMSVSLMGMSRHRRSEDSVRPAGRTHFFRKGFFPAILVGILMLAFIRTRNEDREPAQLDDETALRGDSLRAVAQDLSNARRDIQQAVSDVIRVVPPIPAIPPIPSIPSKSGSSQPKSGSDAASQPGSVTVVRAAVAGINPKPESAATSSSAASNERPRKRFNELSVLAQKIRARLDKTSPLGEGEPGIAQAAESANGDVVVLQLSDLNTRELLGESGRAFLQSYDSDIPERIRQTFALIPLTSPVDPVSPMNPVLANGVLEAIANLMASMADRTEPAVPGESPQLAIVSAVPAEADSDRPMPEWIEKPGAGHVVVKTEPLLSGESEQQPLRNAINKALGEHLSANSESMDPILREQTRFVKLELDSKTAERCIVQRFVRLEELETGVEGPKPFRQVYALLEFPESVDLVAEQRIRQSLQSDRMAGLGVIVMCVWLAVCSAGSCVRLWNSGTGWLKLTAIPMMGLAAVALTLCATGLTIAFARGTTVRPPWADNAPPVVIHLESRG